MAKQVKLTVILNESSGEAEKSDVSILVTEALRKVGCDPTIEILNRERKIKDILRDAAGGDGTISSVVNAMINSKSPLRLGLLPMGTLNHFTKDLRIPQKLEEAAVVIARGLTKSVDVAEVNGKYFINNSSIGAYPMVVLDREAQERKGGSKWPSLVKASFRALKKFETIGVSIAMEGKPMQSRETPLIFVGNNLYSLQGEDLGTRTRLDSGILTVLITKKSSRTHLFFDAMLALFGHIRDAKYLDVEFVRALTIRTEQQATEVSLDGEVVKLNGPLHYRSVPNAVKVIVPVSPVSV
jgi:diacylglycerol kinase family enzyme